MTISSLELLRDLIAFPTVSADPNLDLITHCANLLKGAGAEVTLIKDETGLKANLFASVGPVGVGGVLLSGHTDVVPVTGQDWSVPPFELTQKDDQLFGRGTADMKGFVACAMAAMLRAAKMDLQTPLHLALSYDEEVGCVGVRSLIEMLDAAPFTPQFCIVGEPTEMRVATGHKGKTAGRITSTGRAGHSALAPSALNAIHMACDMISLLREMQDQIAREGAQDESYDVAYTTLHVGRIEGGVALNIVPDQAVFEFEIRNLAEDDPRALLDQIEAKRDHYVDALKQNFPEADVSIEITNSYPPLGTPVHAPVVGFVNGLTGGNATIKVAFGTEGGLFSTQLNVPTVVCGPGSMAQGHKADEFIRLSDLAECDAMMEALLVRLQSGL